MTSPATRLRKEAAASTDPSFHKHLASLELPDADAYRQWCARHGFCPRLSKSWRERLKERSFAVRGVSDARLARHKLESQASPRLLSAIFRGEVTAEDFSQPHLRAICQSLAALDADSPAREAFSQLLQHTARQTNFFSPTLVIAAFGQQPLNNYVSALAAIAQQQAAWIRPLSAWTPRTHNPRRQLTSLLTHLFARWPVPTFMDAAWVQSDPSKAAQHQQWYLHLARGASIRTAGLPIEYTKRMVHHFLHAPTGLTIDGALRWGQVRAMGACETLARRLLTTRLGASFEDNEFWVTAIRFFIENSSPALWYLHLGPICDYLRQARLQPGFSLRGRSLASLMRDIGLWHRLLAAPPIEERAWTPTPIKPFIQVEGNCDDGTQRIWTITELVTSNQLVEEGRTLQHCVATYSPACEHGDTSIWSLQMETIERRRKVLTIEVERTTRIIRQVKGRRNSLPATRHIELLRSWCSESGLTLASWIDPK